MSEATIGPCIEAYFAFLKERRAKRTLRNAEVACGLFITFLGNESAPLSTMSKPKLDGFYTWCRNEKGRHGRPRSLDTCAKYVENVQLWWKWAANQDKYVGHIPPARTVDVLPKDPKAPTIAPTWEEMDAAIACAPTWYPLLLGAMRTLGLRVSQVLGLKVGDIVHDQYKEGLELRFPGALGKTAGERRGRTMPIAGGVVWFFDRLLQGRDETADLIPMFPQTHRRARPETVGEAWKRAGVRKVVWQKRPDHAFRKGFESGLRALDVERDAIEYLAGRSLGTVERYVDPIALKLRREVNKMPPFSTDAYNAIDTALKLAGLPGSPSPSAPPAPTTTPNSAERTPRGPSTSTARARRN